MLHPPFIQNFKKAIVYRLSEKYILKSYTGRRIISIRNSDFLD